MAIKDKDYASFFVDVEEHRNQVTGKIDKIDVDFTDTKEATGKDEEGTPIKVVDIKELKSKIRKSNIPKNVQLPSLKNIKKYKSKTKTWGGKALRYKKGQKDGKGGQIMPLKVQQAFRDIAKKEKISINKAITKYQNKKISDSISQPLGQHDIEKLIGAVKNKNLLVNVKDSSGKTYRFTGTGNQILNNPNFQLLYTRNMNRVYTAIKNRDKLK